MKFKRRLSVTETQFSFMQDKIIRKENLKKERYKFLLALENRLELPMIILGIVWLIMLITSQTTQKIIFFIAFDAIWILFLMEFVIKFLLAPEKLVFFQRNWFLLVSILIPFLRIGRIIFYFKRKKTLQMTNYFKYKSNKKPF